MLGLVRKMPVGLLGTNWSTDGSGKRTPWCRQAGQTVEESGSEGCAMCRSGHKIAGRLVWKKTTRSLQGEGCHVGLNLGWRESRSRYILAA